MKIAPLTQPVQHSEAPVWNPNNESLLFVDVFKKTLFKYDYNKKSTVRYTFPNDNYIGVVIPIKNTTDQYFVAIGREIYKFIWNGNNKAVVKNKIVEVEKDKLKNHFNDGKADRQGRLWIGTLTRNEDLTVTSNGGSLFLFHGKNLTQVEEKIQKTSISNGLDWSLDSKKFYYIDSEERNIVCYDFNKNTTEISNKTVIFDLKDHPDLKGIPDGMTIDFKGNLWVALFGGKSVININPETSQLITRIELPATYVTSACFGGPNYDILFVTTSRLHLNNEEILKEPLAGCVFAIENLGVYGIPCANQAMP